MVAVGATVLMAVPSFAGAQSSGLEVDLPSNSDCRGAAVIAKTTVVEDAAAANMLAEALRIVSPRGDQRCLLDAGLPPDARDSSLPGVPPDGVYRRSAALAAKIYVVGGPAAIPDRWLADQFGVTQFTRIAGADRWRTQENVAAAMLALAAGREVSGLDGGKSAGGFADNGVCSGTAVLAKLTVVEERAAANMLAEALTAISGDPGSRCLIDVGDPGAATPVPPRSIAVAEAERSTGAYLLGGTAAVPDAWIDGGFDIRFVERLAGADRWETQSIVAQEIIDIARGGTLPHHVILDGHVYSFFHDYMAPLTSDEAESKPSILGTHQIKVHYCYRKDHLSLTSENAAKKYLRQEVSSLNRIVSPFFKHQSDAKTQFKFVVGRVFSLGDSYTWEDQGGERKIDWSSNFSLGFTDENDPPDEPYLPSVVCAREITAPADGDNWGPESGYVLVDQTFGFISHQDFGLTGWGSVALEVAAQPSRSHWANASDFFYQILAHEVGHGWLGLCHTFHRVTSDDSVECPDRHKELVYIKQKDLNDQSRPEICSLMSYCGPRKIVPSEIGTYADESSAFIACGQREVLGWPDGPPTPYGNCVDGELEKLPKPNISQATAEWPSGEKRPYVAVLWNRSQLPACAREFQMQQEQHPQLFNDAKPGRWHKVLPGSSQSLRWLSLKSSAKYSVWFRYRCGGLEGLVSEWSDSREVVTPSKAATVLPPDAPSQLRLTPGTTDIRVEWNEPAGNGAPINRYKVQWRRAGTSSWQDHELTGRTLQIRHIRGSLRSGTAYEVQVRARNSVDWGPWSASSRTITLPRVRPPDAPGAPRLTPGTTDIRVEWNEPAGNGAPVNRYAVQWRRAGTLIWQAYGLTQRTFRISSSIRSGTTYEVQVRARNSVDWGPWSALSRTATLQQQARPPDAPGGVSATAGDGQVTVSWAASRENGSPVTGYTVGWTGGSRGQRSVGSSVRSHVITGLVNGAGYTVTVVAHSAAGASPAAAWSAFPKAADRVPDAPGGVSATAGDGEISVSWAASRENGSPVTGYLVAWSDGTAIGGTTQPASARRYTITGLRNGSRYEVSVTAESNAGPSSETVIYETPQQQARPADPPDAPGAPRLTPGTTDIRVEWNEPAGNGAPVNRYEVQWRRVGASSWQDYELTGRTLRISSSIRSGTAYEVQVRARNSVDWGPWSASSRTTTLQQQVRPPDPPGAPRLSVGDGYIDVSWTAPQDNGAAITRYEVNWSRPGNSGTSTRAGTSLRLNTSREGTRYTFKVRAQNSAGWGPWSSSSSVTTPGGEPSIPIITPTIELSRGGPGPRQTSQGVACGANSPDCRYLRMELRDFAAGRYRIHCVHDGFSGGYRPGYFDSFLVTIGQTGSLSVSNRCFINMAKVLGKGVQITVGRSTDDVGTHHWSSNWLK